ncbi:class I SAM-dependent methyltransferase [Nocardioides sp. cx-169]|uniref:class I SAM-dependent methyltransferase n=1 Tax=Nocardioides sp. cx-169 TaxID=2899080 RepID=UPI001E55563A|nr:class I SAM-dependent methyltransferase [Nocardioides sp. cx-169]MCD4533144.1 class I SAM-dependent methyltransferase [Nocardioides sp. cx-169]
MLEPIRSGARRMLTQMQADASKDLDAEQQARARATSVDFIEANLLDVRGYRGSTPLESKLQLLRDALASAPSGGLVLEFGVASGLTLREIATTRPDAHGFDSFEGLPEDWRSGYEAGRFAQDPPDVNGAELHVGWFADTLPVFLETHPGPIDFVHMDADLYSSTKTIFDCAFDRFVPGTVILFDEYFNYPRWQQHEHKAFAEFLDHYAGGFEYLGYNAMHEQLAVRLT